MLAWGDYKRGEEGELYIPALNKKYVMYEDSVIFVRTGLYQHFVKPVHESSQRHSMVSVVTADMADFDALELPPTPAEVVAYQEVAKDPTEIKTCKFCMREFKNFTGPKGHPSAAIRYKGGDEKDEIEARNAISRNTSRRQAPAGNSRRWERAIVKRKVAAME
jgi:hypothetical protein